MGGDKLGVDARGLDLPEVAMLTRIRAQPADGGQHLCPTRLGCQGTQRVVDDPGLEVRHLGAGFGQ